MNSVWLRIRSLALHKMHTFQRPELIRVKDLLEASQLTVSDLFELDANNFLACGDQHRLKGVVGLEVFDSDGLLRSLAVGAQSQGEGLGKLLVNNLEKLAKTKGIDRLYLLTETAESFFLKLGYETIERSTAPGAIRNSQQFSTLCPDDAVLMRKIL